MPFVLRSTGFTLVSINSPALSFTERFADIFLAKAEAIISPNSGCGDIDLTLIWRRGDKAFSTASNFLSVASRKLGGNEPSISNSFDILSRRSEKESISATKLTAFVLFSRSRASPPAYSMETISFAMASWCLSKETLAFCDSQLSQRTRIKNSKKNFMASKSNPPFRLNHSRLLRVKFSPRRRAPLLCRSRCGPKYFFSHPRSSRIRGQSACRRP